MDKLCSNSFQEEGWMEGCGSSAAQLQVCQAGSFLPKDPPGCGGAQAIPTSPSAPHLHQEIRISAWSQGMKG